MKKITVQQFVADDGTVFDSESKAIAHESLQNRIKQVMLPLKIPADSTRLLDTHKGYWQHDLNAVYEAREGILQILREELEAAGHGDTYPALKNHGKDVHPLCIVGRIIDDRGGPLNDAWRQFCRIDPEGREWQQCYFAYTAPEKPAIPRLNP
jgi:hypothetical protein